MTDFSHGALPMIGDGRSALDVALEATTTAGEIIRGGWDSDRQITFKGRADIVTDIDVAAEKAVLEILTSAFPQFGILAEESQPVAGESRYRWVVDPLDGTRNYAQSIPTSALSSLLPRETTSSRAWYTTRCARRRLPRPRDRARF